MESSALFELNGISYSYLGRFPALEDVSLTVAKGERLALLGANGSGKSTLLLVLAGLIFSKAGRMKFLGDVCVEESFQDADFRIRFRSRVGIVFQNSDVQLFNSNVADEVRFGLEQLELPGPEIDRRMSQYMDLMAIRHLADRSPQNLSIGEKKRVAITSVLAMEPEIILLDEPTAGLDPRTTRHLIDAMSAFAARGATIITATQDIHMVCEIAERVIVLGEDKRIVRDGNASDVLNDKAFLEKHNLVHVHIHRHEDKTHTHPHEHISHHHPQ